MGLDTRLLTGVGVMAAVIDAGNFARAGERLGLTPSGVSRAVARLEQRLGIRLFDRSPRGVRLTDEGRRFHARVAPLLADLEEAADEAAGAAAAVRGHLRVSVDPWFARLLLAPRLGDFLAAHPGLRVDLLTSNHREEMMQGVDIALRFGPPDGALLMLRRIFDTRVLTVAAPAYLARRGRPRSPDELAGHELLLFRDPLTGLAFPWEFRRDGRTVELRPDGRLMVDDPSVAIAACLAGAGIFQSLALGIGPLIAGGALVPVLEDWSDERFPLNAYHASRHRPPAKVRAFLDFVAGLAATP